ncbi:heme-binding protein [Streptomyces canus]|uniref:heme-binding protein n=1 Tax=Streptomyces canus TaxID=58343 RepID=UPI0036E8F7C0
MDQPNAHFEQAVLRMRNAAVTEARRREAPVGIAVVDASGLLRGFVLMDGAAPLAEQAAPKMVRTAAYMARPQAAWAGPSRRPPVFSWTFQEVCPLCLTER